MRSLSQPLPLPFPVLWCQVNTHVNFYGFIAALKLLTEIYIKLYGMIDAVGIWHPLYATKAIQPGLINYTFSYSWCYENFITVWRGHMSLHFTPFWTHPLSDIPNKQRLISGRWLPPPRGAIRTRNVHLYLSGYDLRTLFRSLYMQNPQFPGDCIAFAGVRMQMRWDVCFVPLATLVHHEYTWYRPMVYDVVVSVGRLH